MQPKSPHENQFTNALRLTIRWAVRTAAGIAVTGLAYKFIPLLSLLG